MTFALYWSGCQHDDHVTVHLNTSRKMVFVSSTVITISFNECVCCVVARNRIEKPNFSVRLLLCVYQPPTKGRWVTWPKPERPWITCSPGITRRMGKKQRAVRQIQTNESQRRHHINDTEIPTNEQTVNFNVFFLDTTISPTEHFIRRPNMQMSRQLPVLL